MQVCDSIGALAAHEMEQRFGFDWKQIVPAMPWDAGDVLHVLRKYWRDVFARYVCMYVCVYMHTVYT